MTRDLKLNERREYTTVMILLTVNVGLLNLIYTFLVKKLQITVFS